MTIVVCDMLQTNDLLSPRQGEVLRNKIIQQLELNNSVCLDFINYKSLSSSFLNEVIGKLIIQNNWTPAIFKEKVLWKNIDEDDQNTIEMAIDNAKTKLYLINNKIDQAEFYQRNLPTM
jgi:hypothetical protein